MNVTVGSWNIWVFGSRDFRGIGRFVKDSDIDVIGMQEVGIYFDHGTSLNMAEMIAKELDFNYAFYPAADTRPKGNYILGNAVFSKFPILSSASHPLNPAGVKYDGSWQTEPRILVQARINLDGEEINFLTTHLEFSLGFETTESRMYQTERIISLTRNMKEPVVLTGDFNSLPQNKEIKNIEKILTKLGGDDPTWTVHPWEDSGWKVDGLKYRLDNIFVSKGVKIRKFEILRSDISDHLPIKAELEV